MFRRRRRDDADDGDLTPDDTLADEAGAESGSSATAAEGRPQGPWDLDDVPDADAARLDLGAIRLPIPDDMEVRVDVQDNVVVAATVVAGNSALQIHAFAAPRSSGIWRDVRTEIAQSLRESGGEAQDSDGPFGTELRARIPAEVPGQARSLQAARFVGVDGPRWFLRGMLTGPAATDPVQARTLEDVFRSTVVVRGGDAMAPRELLPLRLPKEANEHPPTETARPTLDMLERGPEITETR